MTDKYEQLKADIKKASSPYGGFIKRTMDSARMAIIDLQEENSNFITTIESQKEEIENQKLFHEGYSEESIRIESQLRDQINSLKAITELAVEALNRVLEGNFIYPQERSSFIKGTLSDIKRLQNE
jgi:hypothetical protein